MISKVHKHPFINLKAQLSQRVLLALILLMTALNGVSIDLFTPSLPAIAHAMGVSATAAKASLSIGLFGFGLGVLTLGMASDRIGRRGLTLIGLLLFTIASVTAALSTNYDIFMFSRLIQGAGVAVAAMLSRAMVLDHFKGKQLNSAMLYTTIAWGLGPVIAPFIGGYLQQYFGWHMNFVFYAVYGIVSLLLAAVFLPETLKKANVVKAKYLHRIGYVFNRAQFLVSATMCAFGFTQYVLYSLVGPFLVEKTLGFSPVVFGHTALLTGLGYFMGALSGRYLQRWFNPRQLISIGLGVILLADMILFALGALFPLSLWTIVAPMMLMIYGVGLLFSNAIAKTLEPFKTHAGAAVSLHGTTVIVLGGVFTSLIGHFAIHSVTSIAVIVAIATLGQIALMLISRRVGTETLVIKPSRSELDEELALADQNA